MINAEMYEYRKRPILRNLTNAIEDIEAAMDGVEQRLEPKAVTYFLERALSFCKQIQDDLDLTEKQRKTGRITGR